MHHRGDSRDYLRLAVDADLRRALLPAAPPGHGALVGAFLLFGLAVVTEYFTRAGVNEAGRLANEANRFAASALRNGEVVRGLGMGDVVLDRWSGAQFAHIAVHSRATERGAALHALVKFVRLTVQISLLCAGAWLAIDRQFHPAP